MTLNLIIHELLHGIVAIPFTFIIWRKTHSYSMVLLAFTVTYIIDVDHLVDYFRFYGFKFNLKDFLDGNQFSSGKALIPLHGWEYVILLFVFAKRNWNSLSSAALMGYIPHLILDTINVGSISFYFLTYRLFSYFL